MGWPLFGAYAWQTVIVTSAQAARILGVRFFYGVQRGVDCLDSRWLFVPLFIAVQSHQLLALGFHGRIAFIGKGGRDINVGCVQLLHFSLALLCLCEWGIFE